MEFVNLTNHTPENPDIVFQAYFSLQFFYRVFTRTTKYCIMESNHISKNVAESLAFSLAQNTPKSIVSGQ